MLDAIEINPNGRPRASVIWLHGLGADGHDFEPLIPQLGLVSNGVRFVLPHAPMRDVTINGGARMRAWYDIRWPDVQRDIDEAGIRASIAELQILVERELASGIPAQCLVLAGFSQGGVIGLLTGLTMASPLAGILALSTYLPLPADTLVEDPVVHRTTPIMLAHGTADSVIPIQLAAAARDSLSAQGYTVDWRTYAMAHAVCADEIKDIRNWLSDRISGSANC